MQHSLRTSTEADRILNDNYAEEFYQRYERVAHHMPVLYTASLYSSQ